MNITDIKIRKTYTEGRLRAIVSIVIDSELAIHDIKVIEGPERLFVAMPSRKEEVGYKDIVHPINPDTRKNLENIILDKYHQVLNEMAMAAAKVVVAEEENSVHDETE